MATTKTAPRGPFDVSWLTLWRVGIFVFLAAIAVSSWDIILGIFLALVISSGIEFIVSFLDRRGVPRTLGVILVFLTGAILVVTFVYTLIPIVIIDLNNAFEQLTKFGDDSLIGPLISVKTAQGLSAFVNDLSASLLSSAASPLEMLSQIVGGFALGMAIVISSFYLSLSRDGVRRFLLAIVPDEFEDDVLDVYDRSLHRIGLWFRSQLALSVLMGGFALAILMFLGVKYAMVLAILTAVMELVPYIGPIISGGIAILAALISSPDGMQLAIYTLIAFIVLHQIEQAILVPILVGRGVGLHPVVIIAALLVGAEAAGFLGIIISVPVAVILQEIIEKRSSLKAARRGAPA